MRKNYFIFKVQRGEGIKSPKRLFKIILNKIPLQEKGVKFTEHFFIKSLKNCFKLEYINTKCKSLYLNNWIQISQMESEVVLNFVESCSELSAAVLHKNPRHTVLLVADTNRNIVALLLVDEECQVVVDNIINRQFGNLLYGFTCI